MVNRFFFLVIKMLGLECRVFFALPLTYLTVVLNVGQFFLLIICVTLVVGYSLKIIRIILEPCWLNSVDLCMPDV